GDWGGGVGLGGGFGGVVVVLLVRPAAGQVVGGVAAPAVGRDRRDSGIGRAGSKIAAIHLNSGDQLHEARRVAPVERQLVDPPLVNHVLERRADGVNGRRLTDDGLHLRDRPYAERHVQPHFLVDSDDDAFLQRFFGAVFCGGDAVAPDGKRAQRVDASVVRDGPERRARAGIDGGDARARNDRSRFVFDYSGNHAGGSALSVGV